MMLRKAPVFLSFTLIEQAAKTLFSFCVCKE